MRFEDFIEPAYPRSIRFLDTGDEDIEEARDIIRQRVDLAYERIKPKPGEIAWRSTGQVLMMWIGKPGHSWSPSRDTDACPICGECGEHTKSHE